MPDTTRECHVELCHVDDVGDGKSLGLDPLEQGRDSLFIVRRGDLLRAYRNVCPHQGSTLPWRKNEFLNSDGTKVVCHAHGAEFDIDSGRCTRGAALGLSLDAIAIRVTADGVVRAALSSIRP